MNPKGYRTEKEVVESNKSKSAGAVNGTTVSTNGNH